MAVFYGPKARVRGSRLLDLPRYQLREERVPRGAFSPEAQASNAQLFARTSFALARQIFTVSAKLRCLGRGLAVAGIHTILRVCDSIRGARLAAEDAQEDSEFWMWMA